MVYHFCIRILSGLVPVCAATSFFKSPTVSSSLQDHRNIEAGRLEKKQGQYGLQNLLALDSNLLSQPVVQNHLNHAECDARNSCYSSGDQQTQFRRRTRCVTFCATICHTVTNRNVQARARNDHMFVIIRDSGATIAQRVHRKAASTLCRRISTGVPQPV